MVKCVLLEPRCVAQLEEINKSNRFAYGLILGQVIANDSFVLLFAFTFNVFILTFLNSLQKPAMTMSLVLPKHTFLQRP